MKEARKSPAFQFYPGDWRRDTALQACSLIARGLWHEMLCIMHDGEPYGHLAISGRPISESQLARMVGESLRAVQKALAELDGSGVFSRTDDGTIFSRRMIRDDRLRTARAEGGQKGASYGVRGGRPRSCEPVSKQPLDLQEGVLEKPHEVEQKNPPAFASAVCSLQLQGESSTNTQRVDAQARAAEAAPPTGKQPRAEQNPAALQAWADACWWVRQCLTDLGPTFGAPPLAERTGAALGSVGAQRMRKALVESGKELGFVRREFLQAWWAFEPHAAVAGAGGAR